MSFRARRLRIARARKRIRIELLDMAHEIGAWNPDALEYIATMRAACRAHTTEKKP